MFAMVDAWGSASPVALRELGRLLSDGNTRCLAAMVVSSSGC